MFGRLDTLLLLQTFNKCILDSLTSKQGYWWHLWRIPNNEIIDVVIINDVSNISGCLLHTLATTRQMASTFLLCISNWRLLLLKLFILGILNKIVATFCHFFVLLRFRWTYNSRLLLLTLLLLAVSFRLRNFWLIFKITHLQGLNNVLFRFFNLRNFFNFTLR